MLVAVFFAVIGQCVLSSSSSDVSEQLNLERLNEPPVAKDLFVSVPSLSDNLGLVVLIGVPFVCSSFDNTGTVLLVVVLDVVDVILGIASESRLL